MHHLNTQIHHHSITTFINKQCVCAWMPTAHQSVFAVAAFCVCQTSMGARIGLQLALLAVNERPLGYKLPHDWLVLIWLLLWYLEHKWTHLEV